MIPGFPAYNWWLDPPDEILLKVYAFNVTNTFRFLNGKDKKMKMQEVGPFVFSERVRHTDVVFNENSTLTYTVHRTAVFLPELSGNLTLDTRLILPNFAYIVSNMRTKIRVHSYKCVLYYFLSHSRQGHHIFQNLPFLPN